MDWFKKLRKKGPIDGGRRETPVWGYIIPDLKGGKNL